MEPQKACRARLFSFKAKMIGENSHLARYRSHGSSTIHAYHLFQGTMHARQGALWLPGEDVSNPEDGNFLDGSHRAEALWQPLVQAPVVERGPGLLGVLGGLEEPGEAQGEPEEEERAHDAKPHSQKLRHRDVVLVEAAGDVLGRGGGGRGW